jgi:hypothetical protein
MTMIRLSTKGISGAAGSWIIPAFPTHRTAAPAHCPGGFSAGMIDTAKER